MNGVASYSVHQPLHPRSPYVMLPPLRAVVPPAIVDGMTVSDCSDLSAPRFSSQPHNHHKHHTHHVHTPHHIAPMHVEDKNSSSSNLGPVLPVRSAYAANVTSGSTSLSSTLGKVAKRQSASKSRSRVLTPASMSVAAAAAVLSPNSVRSHGHGMSNGQPTPKKVRSSKSNIPGESRYWTPSEHKLFIEALIKFGPKDLKSISEYVGTRNMVQCRTHEQKCFMRLMRDAQRVTSRQHGVDQDSGGPRGSSDKGRDEKKSKHQKDVYSVPSSCGITLLCVVGEEMMRSLEQ